MMVGDRAAQDLNCAERIATLRRASLRGRPIN